MNILHYSKIFVRNESAAATVEFALVIVAFLLIVAGIMDLGHAFYMNQVITNASREGARYGVVYQTNTNGTRKAPSGFSPTIKNHLLYDYNLGSYLPPDAAPNVSVVGDASTTSGEKLQVTVTAKKTWFILNDIMPSLGSSKTLSATTVMRLE